MLEIEPYVPKENFFVGLLWDEGYWFFKILRRQPTTKYMPWAFDEGVAVSAGGTSGWESPADAEGREYLQPREEEIVYQFFTGFAPSTTKAYLQYSQRVDRMNLIAPRIVPGVIGFWDGEQSPYRDPSPCTELWVVHDIFPWFNGENPGIVGESEVIGCAFYINAFSYQVIENKDEILQFLRGNKRATIRTMGDPWKPMGAPGWLKRNYKKFMVSPSEV